MRVFISLFRHLSPLGKGEYQAPLGRRDLLVSMQSMFPVGETSRSRCNKAAESPLHCRARALACHTRMQAGFPRHRFAVRPHHLCRSGSPDPDLFVIRRSQTTELGLARRPVLRAVVAWRGTGPRPTVKGDRSGYRSAGACPPRSFQAPERFSRDRCVARDRPSPYGKRGRSGCRSAGACPPRSFQAPERVVLGSACERVSSRSFQAGIGPRPTGKRHV